MPPFPATYSTPSPGALREQLLPGYPIGPPTACRLHMSGVNDIYTVQTESRKYILKVYRAGWRSRSEVLYELDLLFHLHRAGVAVALPVPRQDGELSYPLPALEGVRQAVLFHHAPGRQPTWPFYEDEAESRLMGRTLATIHNAGADFVSPHARFQHDETTLLHQPLAAAHPFLMHREADWEYLLGLTERIRKRLAGLTSRGLSWGVCHGDFHCGNAFITDDETVTVFDFDVCGAGWLAFDLARWKANTEGKPGISWQAFLSGYEERRTLSEADKEAVPLFLMLRIFDWMRVKTTFATSGAWGPWDMDFYFNDTLATLKQREDEALGGSMAGR